MRGAVTRPDHRSVGPIAGRGAIAGFGGPPQSLVEPSGIEGRTVAILVDNGVDSEGVSLLSERLRSERARPQTVGGRDGFAIAADGRAVPIARTLASTRSVEFDAIVVASGADGLLAELSGLMCLKEAYSHLKLVGAWGVVPSRRCNY